MRTRLAAAFLVALAVLGCLAGCSDSGPSDEDVLASLTDLVIIPRYEAVAERMGALSAALADLRADPSSEDALARARAAWFAARADWSRSRAFWFGPVTDRRSVGLMDWHPVEPERIEAMLASRPARSEADARDTLGSTMRGLGAAEYLIFDADAARKLADPARADYMVALGDIFRSESAAILREWSTERAPGAVSYGGFFTGRAADSMLASAAVDDLVSAQIFLLKRIVDMRLAAALGMLEGGADLSAIPEGYAENGAADLRAEILGIRDMYAGHESAEGALGISHLVAAISPDADARMIAHFAAAISAVDGLDALEGSLTAAVVDNPDKVRAVYEALSELQMTLETEVVSLLGVTVGFSDTDGDSAR